MNNNNIGSVLKVKVVGGVYSSVEFWGWDPGCKIYGAPFTGGVKEVHVTF